MDLEKISYVKDNKNAVFGQDRMPERVGLLKNPERIVNNKEMELQNDIVHFWENYNQYILGFGRSVIIAALIIIGGKLAL
jgi:hypothetical protein